MCLRYFGSHSNGGILVSNVKLFPWSITYTELNWTMELASWRNLGSYDYCVGITIDLNQGVRIQTNNGYWMWILLTYSIQGCKWFRNWKESRELASKPALLGSESHDAEIGIKFLGSHWNQNQLLLESESWILVKPEIRIKNLWTWIQVGMSTACHSHTHMVWGISFHQNCSWRRIIKSCFVKIIT